MVAIYPDLCAAVRAHAQDCPEKPFYTLLARGETSEFTYSELWARSGDFAASYQDRGLKAGDLVIVSMPTSPDLFSAFVGAMRMGAVPAIIPYPNAKQKSELFWNSHATLFNQIEPSAFVLTGVIADCYDTYLPQFSPAILRCEDVGRGSPEPFSIDPKSVAFLQHSSGTTSLKKGVMLTHQAVVDHVLTYAGQCGIGPESRLFSWLPLYHDMGLISCFMMPLVAGLTVTAMDNFEWVARPASMLQAIAEHRLEYAWMPNFGFAHLVRACPNPENYDLSSLKAIINCSEPCRPETQNRFLAHFAPSGLKAQALQVCYAMAENVFAVTQTDFSRPAGELALSPAAFDKGRAEPTRPDEVPLMVASCGQPVPGNTITIVDDVRKPLPDGYVGEVAIASRSLFAGYNRRLDLTERALVGDTYYSGDLGFVLNNELYLTGRKDDLILAYGRNLLAHELEALVNDVPGVKPGRVVVFDVWSPLTNTAEVVVMGETTLAPEEQKALIRNIRATLDSAAGVAPRHIVVLADGELIKTTSGKISRAGNRKAFLKGQAETEKETA